MTSVLSFKPVKSWVARMQGGPRPLAASAAVRTEETSTATVLHIHGRLTMEQVGSFSESVEEALGGNAPRLVVNLTACPFIDSAGIAALVTALGRARKAGRELILVGLAPQVVSALTMARLVNAFPVCNTLEEALSAPPDPRKAE